MASETQETNYTIKNSRLIKNAVTGEDAHNGGLSLRYSLSKSGRQEPWQCALIRAPNSSVT